MRLKTLLLWLCLGVIQSIFSQGLLRRGEYFIDSDPGQGNGIALTFTPAADVSLNFNVNLNGLSDGVHLLFVRFYSDSGWSHPLIKPFMVSRNTNLSSASLIQKGEYFIDNDPGFGNALPINVSPDSIITYNQNLAINSLTPGLHRLGIRFRDSNFTWSETFNTLFLYQGNNLQTTIQRVEYFIDTDPGYGNGTALSFTSDSVLILQFNANLTALSNGLHMLYFRSMDSNGNWSHNYVRPILVSNIGNAQLIRRIEYFFDTDPGFGNGFPASLLADSVLELNFTAALSSLNQGIHSLYVRAEDNDGKWSHVAQKIFYLARNTNYAQLNKLEYFVDNDPGIGNAHSIALTPTFQLDSIILINIDTVAEGHHKIYIRSQDLNGNWSHTNYDAFCVGPQANFVVGTTCLKDSVVFTNLSDSTFQNTVYQWDINNDGVIDYTNSGNVSYLFDTAGLYHTHLIVYNDPSCPDTFAVDVKVDPLALANFEAHPDSFSLTCTFENLSTPNTYSFWDFGDGTFSNELNPVHVYPAPGYYYVCLNVIDTSTICPSQHKICKAVLIKNDTTGCFAAIDYSVLNTTQVQFSSAASHGNPNKWYWEFGDGTISHNPNPVHTYPAAGIYTVRLSIENEIYNCVSSFSKTVVIDSINDCKANFLFYSEMSDTTVYFMDISQGNNISNRIWSFGDGQFSNELEPVHRYDSVGFYNVCLTIFTQSGCSDTWCRNAVKVGNNPNSCDVEFSYYIDSTFNKAPGSKAVTFKGTAWGEPAKNNWDIQWNFGDGTFASNTLNPTHQYSDTGYYFVHLRISGANCVSNYFDYINVGTTDEHIRCAFAALVDDSVVNKANQQPVKFKGTAFGEPARFSWDFGDGSTDSLTLNPVHQYDSIGYYRVCFTVWDLIIGQSDTYCDSILVGDIVTQSPENLLPEKLTVNCYPNPFRGFFVTDLFINEPTTLKFIISDISGRIITEKSENVNAGFKRYYWDSKAYNNGIYFLQIQTSQQSYYFKLIKAD